ncbi:MAG: hypothetical protein EZS28_045321, partial [Streblomastix strix]
MRRSQQIVAQDAQSIASTTSQFARSQMLQAPCVPDEVLKPVFNEYTPCPAVYHAISWLVANSVVYSECMQASRISAPHQAERSNDLTSLPQLRFVGDGFNQKSSLNLSSCIFLLPTEYTFLKDGQHA